MNENTAPDPLTEARWQQWCDWAAGQGFVLPARDGFDQDRARVWEASELVATTVERYPDAFADLLTTGDLFRDYGERDLGERLAAMLQDAADEGGLHRVLRALRRREIVRVIWRDIAGHAPLDETLRDLSELADVCIAQALDRLHAWTCAELGVPRDRQGSEQRLVVLGMGKLGARELNLSSDIDLIFAFPHSGEVHGGPRALSNEQFFVRLAQRLVQALGNQTADGFVFRVDTRLRPFGDAGPLVMSFDAMEDYYQSQAREWERYAMIKARVVAGDPEDAARLTAMLRPFVYRRYLDFGAIESLREMKALIGKELYRKGMDANIKLGPGGIREIEFIGQAFQLIRGGRDPDLQIRPILEVLRRLGDKALLPRPAVERLAAAYRFLRLTENRLQAYRDKQTHRLPSDDRDRWRLARSMGFDGWDAFASALKDHRRAVQAQFDELFDAPHAGDESPEPSLANVWLAPGKRAADEAALQQAGFTDPPGALSRLDQFRDAAARKGLSRKGSDRLSQLMPLALQVVAASDQPDLALERVLRVLEAVVQRTAYLAMLVEYPSILSQLARLAAMSPWITDQVARHPLLLDELLDPRRLYAPLRREDLEGELNTLLAPIDAEDLEQQMERLRQFAQGNMLRVAAADLTGAIRLMVVSDYLTEIAEVAVERVLALTFEHLVARHGRPMLDGGASTGFLVLGYGKLGGIELGYGSDLDLVFLHGAEQPLGTTDGEKEISNEQFYARLGQRMIHMMTTHTPSGILYDVDMRLRPDGNKGLLVRSLSAFAEYQAAQAWTWEHQALVRARPVAGDPLLSERFSRVRNEILCRERDPERLRADVAEMRARMRASLDKSRAGRFDLKQGHGGIADIEFMVQYSVLRWAAQHPELVVWTDNIRLLETLARLDLLPGQAAEDLTEAYKALRAVYHRSALQEQPTTVPDDRLIAERERVQALWRELIGD